MVRLLPLTRGKTALVDDDDFERIAQHRWHARPRENDQKWYAQRKTRCNGRSTTVYLHREILGATSGVEVDHRDLDGLNCQKTNLRFATRSQQTANQRARRESGIKGVSFIRRRAHQARPWNAQIEIDGRRRHIGNFATEEEAGRAYDRKARELFGPFARLNFPDQEEESCHA